MHRFNPRDSSQIFSKLTAEHIVGGNSDSRLTTERKSINIMKYHLAILTPGWIDLILDGSEDHREPFHESPVCPVS